ncbi:unnamed protein product [Clavelina lepadiformis]|uniref:Uncharacterized protein n=1 Tax=Clavelina lepadiformis TaxID=159417 RepID=A0ABP0FG09_CLALP
MCSVFLQMPRKCIKNADNFCYICGEITFSSQKRSITAVVRKANLVFNLYFGCKVGDQDKSWAPHICCNSCGANLRQWLHGKRKCMPFAVPMVWREPTDHISDCYFCMIPPVCKGLSRKKKQSIQYTNIPSAIRPVPHGELLPVPEAPKEFMLRYVETLSSKEPHLITRNELHDLIRDLELPKVKSELLGSRLQLWNLLAKSSSSKTVNLIKCHLVKRKLHGKRLSCWPQNSWGTKELTTTRNWCPISLKHTDAWSAICH